MGGSGWFTHRNEEFNASYFFNNATGLQRTPYRFNVEGLSVGGPVITPRGWSWLHNKLFFFGSQKYTQQLVDFGAAYLHHARLAVTPENPYYFKKRKGIWWYAHGKWSSATFPGWITALAGSDTGDELLARLQTIRALAIRLAQSVPPGQRLRLEIGW